VRIVIFISSLFFSPISAVQAQITADIDVSQAGSPLGTITVELDHVNAPMATANFIGLASGEFNWIDSATGLIKSKTPYYDGIIFHRIIDGFMNQVGSQNGLGTDGPGYIFQDGTEISNGLDHAEAYKISMPNSGPNTNGSQIFLTAVPTPWLDGKHIVFGEISASGNSRSIVEQINNLPTDSNNRPINEVRIESVRVNYNGVNFDPSAQGLPVVTGQALNTPITPTTTSLSFTQPLSSDFHLVYSEDLRNWNRSETRSILNDESPLTAFEMPILSTGQSKQFYLPTLVSYDYDITPAATLANRTLTLLTAVDPQVPFIFVFNSDGVTGTWSFPRAVDPLAGNISNSFYARDHLGGRLIMILNGINFNYWNIPRIGYDDATPILLIGRHNGSAAIGSPAGNQLNIEGSFTLTK
jgi:peptidyl-prolyl cis-trans isomerase A (cyclophilin A)